MREGERESAETKAVPSVCVLSCPSSPGQRSQEASYFWLLSGWGKRQRQQGAAVFYEVPWLTNTRPLIRLGFLGEPSPASQCMSACPGMSMSEEHTKVVVKLT